MADEEGLITTESAVRLLLLEGSGELEAMAREGWFKRAARARWRTEEVVQGRIRQLQKLIATGPQMTQMQYSRHRGVSAKLVTDWKLGGKIVMTADGQKVDVLRSDAKLDARPGSYRGGYTGGASGSGNGELANTAAAVHMKETYLAKLRQIEYDRQAGLVVDIHIAARSIAAKLAVIRNKLLGLGSRLAPRLVVLKDPAACKAVIDDDVGDMLKELSTYDVYRDTAGYADDDGEDSAEPLQNGGQPS